MEEQETSILMDHTLPLDQPLATSTPTPISILSAEQAGWNAATIKTGGPNTAKRVYEQEEIWQTQAPIPSGELFYDKRLKLFENYNQKDGETQPSPHLKKLDESFGSIVFVPESTDAFQEVDMEDAPVPQTPITGLRRATRHQVAQSTVKKVAQLKDNIKVFPQTEPRKPIKGILKTPSTPFEASGFYRAGKNTGTGTTHRTLGWYDSTSFSPLESSGELREIAAKKGAKKGKAGKKRVEIDESVEERILSSSASDDDEEPRRGAKARNYKEDSSSDFDDSDDGETPSKNPRTKKGTHGGGRKAEKKKESSGERELEESKEEKEEEEEEEEQKPEPKKRSKPQVAPDNGKKKRKKKKDDDAGRFKPEGSSSDSEEVQKPRPRRGRKAAEVVEAEDHDDDGGREEEEEAGSNVGTDQASEGRGTGNKEREEEGEEEEEEEGVSNAESGSEDSNEGDNSKSRSDEDEDKDEDVDEDVDVDEEEEEGEEEDDDEQGQGEASNNEEEVSDHEYTELEQAPAIRAVNPKRISNLHHGVVPITLPLVSGQASTKENERSLMKRMSVESKRSKANPAYSGLRKVQADRAFEMQEQFKRDGSLREVQLSGVVPSESHLIGSRKETPPAPPKFEFPRPLVPHVLGKPEETTDVATDEKGNIQKTTDDSLVDNLEETRIQDDQQAKIVYPITGEESDRTVALIEKMEKWLREGRTREERYKRKLSEANSKLLNIRKEKRHLKSKLTDMRLDLEATKLELAAKEAVGYDGLSYLYEDSSKQDMISESAPPGRCCEFDDESQAKLIERRGLVQLDVQRFDRSPFSPKLIRNPFKHEDMYHRREIINSMTFPGNAMLADYNTHYFFTCCRCGSLKEALVFFYQDELIWSTHDCWNCPHYCCTRCTRWSGPKEPDMLPTTAAARLLLNGPKATENYEASLYLKGIWWDYIAQRDRALFSPRCDPVTSVVAARRVGLRSMRQMDIETGEPSSKRRKLTHEDVMEAQRLERRPPVVEEEEEEGPEERDDGQGEFIIADDYTGENDNGQFANYDWN